jgi:ferritin-like protein
VTWLIAGVLDAETAAIATYTQLARTADGSDHVTHDLVVEILAGEEDHRRFEGFLREFRSAG